VAWTAALPLPVGIIVFGGPVVSDRGVGKYDFRCDKWFVCAKSVFNSFSKCTLWNSDIRIWTRTGVSVNFTFAMDHFSFAQGLGDRYALL
jgi:hypothetical protein